MAIPVIYSVGPSSGHTGGGQLVTIYGESFRMPPPFAAAKRIHGPWPPDAQAPAPPTPTVQVLFGGVPAINVGVVSTGILQCTTPPHDPSGIPYIAPQPNRAGQIAVPPSDVTVTNLDDDGDPIPGESTTLTQSYSFLRPNLTMPGVAATVLTALVLDLQRQIIPNVEFNPHTDYDATSGDFLNITFQAALPALALINLKVPQAEGRPRATEEEVTFQTDDGTGYEVNRLAVLRDMVLTVLGVSDNQSELLGLAEALEVYFRRTGGLNLPANSDDPNGPTVNFPMYRETDTVFTGRIGVSNVMAFTFTMRLVGVPFADFPGLPVDTTAVGGTFSGAQLDVGGLPGGGLVVQSTK